MNETEFPDHIKWLVDNWGAQLIKQLRSERIRMPIDQAMRELMAADPSEGKRAVDWLVKTYCSGGFLWEDLQGGFTSKVCETLQWFAQHRSFLQANARNLSNYSSIADVYGSIQGFLVEDTQISSKQLKRLEREQVLSQTIIVHRSKDLIVSVPLTEMASVWWGKGTQWCTAAREHNQYKQYDYESPLIILTFPSGLLSKSTGKNKSYLTKSTQENKARKFQLWITSKSYYIMDENDKSVKQSFITNNWDSFKTVVLWALAINYHVFNLVPKAERTQEIWQTMIDKNPFVIACIPKKDLSLQLCAYAIQQDISILKFVPDNFRKLLFTQELARKAVEKHGYFISMVPDHLITQDMVEQAIVQDGNNIKYIPNSFKTDNNYILALKHDCGFKTIPKKYLSYAILLKAVQVRGACIENINKEALTPELCRLAIENDGAALQYIPPIFITKQLCLAAINNYSHAIKWVRETHMDETIARTAVEKNGVVLQYINTEDRTADLCLAAVKSKAVSMKYVPELVRTKDFYMQAVRLNGMALDFIAENLRNKEICGAAINQNPQAYDFLTVRERNNYRIPTPALVKKDQDAPQDRVAAEYISREVNRYEEKQWSVDMLNTLVEAYQKDKQFLQEDCVYSP